MTRSASPAEHDDSGDPVSARIVRHVAAASDRATIQLPPLYDAVEPDALDAVVDSGGNDHSKLVVQFTYAGYRVTVSATETVQIAVRDVSDP